MVRLCSILKASSISLNLRVRVFSLERKKLRATCIVMVLAPWRTPPATKLEQRGPHDADVVDAAVLVEALVLGGEDRRFSTCGHVVDPDHRAALLAELADQLAVGGVDPQRDLRLVVGQRFERRQLRVDDQQHEGHERAPPGPPARRAGRPGKRTSVDHFNGRVFLRVGGADYRARTLAKSNRDKLTRRAIIGLVARL